jgi:bla regulator protein BlaR1
MLPSPISLLVTALALAACMDVETTQKALESMGASGPRPDVMPGMLNETLPFRYPPALFTQKVQGNVTLRIFIDSTGTVLSDSTSVEESSGYPGLDSAAVKGAEALRYQPAMLGGNPISVSILLPVYFRHPEMPPLPGDTLLRRGRR